MSVADKYASAARPGDNPYAEFICYLHQALRILNKRRAGHFGRKNPKYLAKGGVRQVSRAHKPVPVEPRCAQPDGKWLPAYPGECGGPSGPTRSVFPRTAQEAER